MPLGKEVGLGAGHIVLGGDAVGNALFTCHSFARHDSFWPGWAQIAAREAHARASGADLPQPSLTLTIG